MHSFTLTLLRPYRTLLSFWIALALFAPTVVADVVVLSDGRRYEGKVQQEDPETVTIQTKVEGIRVTLGFPRVDVASVEESPLPEGFFAPAPAAPRVSDPKKLKKGAVLYLEIPIIGTFGKQVVAAGLSGVLAYAKLHGDPALGLLDRQRRRQHR